MGRVAFEGAVRAMMCDMEHTDLEYKELKSRIAPIEKRTGLGESAAFLVWFLENVYRLDETEARDAVCDRPNDKGIDGVYVDHNNEEIHFFQAKIRQDKKGRIGDNGPKGFIGSVHQFDTPEKVQSVLDGNADKELKRVAARTQLLDMVDQGYSLIGVYVTNELHNDDSKEYERITEELRVFERTSIAERVIDVNTTDGKKGSFTFDTSYVDPMEMQVVSGESTTSMYVFPARALQLVNLEGIADGSLFRENVRYTLGNTAVNKSIRKSIASRSTHSNFSLFHNGIILLCSEADASESGQLTVHDYSVVNGAQSLTSFYNEKSKLTDDLRVLVRVVKLQDEALSRTITEYSNNQNAIRPRDLRSNHAIMVRLQTEMRDNFGEQYFFEIKRGEKAPEGISIITNDVAGRSLLAFDLHEPWSAHQVYKVFDEKYAQIFGRPEVNASRVVFLRRMLDVIEQALPDLNNRPMASYSITRFFLLYIISRILRNGSAAEYIADPELLTPTDLGELLAVCDEIMKTIIVDLNYESKASDFDYKTILKSSNQSIGLGDALISSYEKDVARDKAASLVGWVPRSRSDVNG